MKAESMEEVFYLFPILETERLTLVEIKQEHLKDIFTLFGDEAVTRFYNLNTLLHEQEGQKILDWFSSRYKERLGIRWGIAIKGKTEIIGTIGFNNFTRSHRANIGFDLQSPYWNKGYITEALRAVIDFGFNKLDINRIEAEVMPGNIMSEKVLMKTGFTNEGTLRQWMMWNGKYFDMKMYSLLRNLSIPL